MAEEKQEKVIYFCTTAGENPEKASIPFVMGNAALAMEIEATVALQGNGVFLAQPEYVAHMPQGGHFPPLKKLITDFIELGGKLAVCVPCMKYRNIEKSDLIEGISLTAAGKLVVEAIEADVALVY